MIKTDKIPTYIVHRLKGEGVRRCDFIGDFKGERGIGRNFFARDVFWLYLRNFSPDTNYSQDFHHSRVSKYFDFFTKDMKYYFVYGKALKFV